MAVVTDFPERLKAGSVVYLGDQHEARRIKGSRQQAHGLVLKLAGVDTPESARALRTQQVYVKAADRPTLPEGVYYHHEILGFDVVDENDQLVGKLSEILETGANDVYVVTRPVGREALLPVIAEVVQGIDLEHRRIRIRGIPGLLD